MKVFQNIPKPFILIDFSSIKPPFWRSSMYGNPQRSERRHLQMGFPINTNPHLKALGRNLSPVLPQDLKPTAGSRDIYVRTSLGAGGFFWGSWRCDQTWQWNIPIFRVQIIYLGKCYSLVSYHFGIFFWVGRSDFAIWMTGGKLSKSACCRPRPDTSGNTVQPHKAQNHPREEEWKLMGTSPFWMDGMDTVNGSPSSASSKAQSTKIHEIMGIQLWFPTDLSLI